jgi:hypothetical protein
MPWQLCHREARGRNRQQLYQLDTGVVHPLKTLRGATMQDYNVEYVWSSYTMINFGLIFISKCGYFRRKRPFLNGLVRSSEYLGEYISRIVRQHTMNWWHRVVLPLTELGAAKLAAAAVAHSAGPHHNDESSGRWTVGVMKLGAYASKVSQCFRSTQCTLWAYIRVFFADSAKICLMAFVIDSEQGIYHLQSIFCVSTP